MPGDRRDYLVLGLGILTAYDGAARGAISTAEFTATVNATVEDAAEPGQLLTAVAALARITVLMAADATETTPDAVLQQLATHAAQLEDPSI